MFQKPNDRAGGRLRLGLLLSLSLSFAFAWLAFLTGQAALAQDADAWQTYTSDDAAYAFDTPPGALLSTSEDASLRYKTVYVQLPTTDTTEYQGVSVMVLENETGAPLSDFVAARYAVAGAPSEMARPALSAQQVDGRAAVRLDRDMVVGDGDSATILVPGDGVVYRINLYGGGIGGPTEPSPQAQAMFERMVASFRVLPVPKTPRALEAPSPSAQAAEPEAATVFTYPMRSGAGVQYGVPVGIVVADTHLEWLGYAIRNLDQWRMKCYGVDWARMIHTGEDWYRLDGANTVGTPVYAVADGVVARHNPGISYPGNVVLIRHRLPDGRNLYSMYGHVANVRVVEGQAVVRGQQIATVLAQNYTGRTPRQHPTYDAHLHFEMRFFLDGSNIYVPGTNAYGSNYPSCTWLYPGRGYTYRIHPDAYPYPSAGYTDPTDFISARLDEPAQGCRPTELVANGGFESGLPGTPWVAANSMNRYDPLIYKSRPRTGTWGGWLGNVVNYADTLAQVVGVPSHSTVLTLSFWWQVRSRELAGNADDVMTVQLTSPAGGPIGAPLIATSAARRGVWVKQTLNFDVSGYAFPTATLSFAGLNDGDNASSFYIDDVSLVRVCPPAAEAAAAEVAVPESPVSLAEPITGTPPFSTTVFLPWVEKPEQEVDKPAALAALACANVLANGDFEAALPGRPWTGVANSRSAVYNDPLISGTRVRTGSRSGRVGSPSVNYYWNELIQTVQLPPNVVSVELSYWRYLDTTETSTTRVYDVFRAGLETDEGIEIVTPLQADNTSSGRRTWVQKTLSLPNASAYSGRKLWVTFKGTTDGNLPSSLYVDDAQLVVCWLR